MRLQYKGQLQADSFFQSINNGIQTNSIKNNLAKQGRPKKQPTQAALLVTGTPLPPTAANHAVHLSPSTHLTAF
jgi:hypothetical protein